MEELIQELVNKFPMALTIYMFLSGAYMIFCAVASFTKTDKDDKIAEKLKRFFSLPIPKK